MASTGIFRSASNDEENVTVPLNGGKNSGDDSGSNSNKRSNVSRNIITAVGVLLSLSAVVLLASSGNTSHVATNFSSDGGSTSSSVMKDSTPTGTGSISTDEISDAASITTSSKPNIIMLVADDLGFNSIGYENYDLFGLTPSLSSLASSGITMTNFYAQEVCTPARAALLTGRYPLSVGMQYGVVATNTAWGLNLGETTIAEVLKNNGYKTHMIGKWHLGHHSPNYLPTARGFDYFTGYLDGSNFYWSKHNPVSPLFHDFLTMDKDCYHTYQGEKMHNFSTHLYRDHAIEIIENHNISEPMFMYLAWQAVHTPFVDDAFYHSDGIPSSYVTDDVAATISETVVGVRRQQYAMSLNILDSAIGEIVDALETSGMMDNTYIIFFSDNGGCEYGGGKNMPYRGMKASLFEGGSKVDAFVYSPLLDESVRGTTYDSLFHITDWFPTIMQLSNSEYVSEDGYELDGVSHYTQFASGNYYPEARDHMLYNSYYNVEGFNFSRWTSGPFAVRNQKYKLIHTYNSTKYGTWNSYDELSSDDDAILDIRDCQQYDAIDGEFFFGLYDLETDPYETTNIYDSTDADVISAKFELYNQLDLYEANSKTNIDNWLTSSDAAEKVWSDQCNGYICPWVEANSEFYTSVSKSYPSHCGISDDLMF